MIYYLFHYSAHERNNEMVIMMIAAVYKNDLFLLTTAVKLYVPYIDHRSTQLKPEKIPTSSSI